MKLLSPISCLCLALAFLTTPATLSSHAPLASPADEVVAITGGTLIDGSGRAPLHDSVVGVTGDSIPAVVRRGQIKIPAGARVIDATGLVVAPGFIDTHNHSDRGFTEDPSAATQVCQGITTVAVGQGCGS